MRKLSEYMNTEKFSGSVWISKDLKIKNRGNVYEKTKNDFRVLAYISPSMLEGKDVDSVVRGIIKANGTMRMLED